MKNGTIPERGEVEWKVGKQSYVLALPLRQLRALDKDLSCGGVLKLMAPPTMVEDPKKPGVFIANGGRGVFDSQIEDIALILRYGLIGGGNKLTDDVFEELWDRCGMMEMVTACDQLLAATLKGADKTPIKESDDAPLPEPPAEPSS